MFLIDTDTLSAALAGTNPILTRRILETLPSKLFVSIVTIEENLRGRLDYVRKCEQAKNQKGLSESYDLLQRTIEQVTQFQVAPVDEAALAIYQTYPASVLRVGKQDCKIAATAASRGWIVITRNARHFDRIGVAHEDWTV